MMGLTLRECNKDLVSFPTRRLLSLWRHRSGWFRAFIVVAMLLYVVKLYKESWPSYVIDYSFADIEPVTTNTAEIATECSAVANTCYHVVDMVMDTSGLEVRRAIYVTGFENEYDSVAHLIPPVGRTFQDSDTRFWAVNHTTIFSQYVAVMIMGPFLVGSIPSFDNTAAPARLLFVGLGGGSMDMWFHTMRPHWQIDVYEIDPAMKTIANKWFHVIENENRRTHVQDGIEAIHEAAQQEKTFDAVFIDACGQDVNLTCPEQHFLNDSLLKSARKIMNPQGSLIVNVLSMRDVQHAADAVQRMLLPHFPACLRFHADIEFNVVFVCLPYAVHPEDVEHLNQHWLLTLNRLVRQIGIEGNVWFDLQRPKRN